VALSEVLDEVRPYTKSSPERISAMASAIEATRDISGHIVECGVWRGGNIILARKLAPDRICWLYDTFSGMTEPKNVDIKKSGRSALHSYAAKVRDGRQWLGVSVDDVKKNFEQTGTLDDSKLRFVVGPVEQTLLKPENLPDRISVLRLDTDWHESTKIELEILYPRLSPGGILIVDDYGHWLGAKLAVTDYFGNHMPQINRIDYTAISLVKPWTR
jgi:O-methyltransferase